MIRNPQNSIGNYLGTYILEWDLAFRAQSISESPWMCLQPVSKMQLGGQIDHEKKITNTIGPTGLQSLGFTASGGT